HGQIAEIELTGELRRTAQAGALERPAKREADAEGNDERGHCQARRIMGPIRYADTNAPIVNSQLPTLSIAPPLNACPLGHPRAITAPAPIATPPIAANARRHDGASAGPRSIASFSRPANFADSQAPATTPRISSTNQSRQALPPSAR